MRTTRTVLVVESEPELLEAMVIALERRGYEVLAAADATAAEEALARGLPDLLIADMLLACASGFRVVQLAAERTDGQLPIVMVSALSAPVHRHYAMALGVAIFLPKPFALSELAVAAENLCPIQMPKTAVFANVHR